MQTHARRKEEMKLLECAMMQVRRVPVSSLFEFTGDSSLHTTFDFHK